MDIKKLNEELTKIMEDQYENEFDSEEYYVVTFTDGSKDDNFWCGDDDLFYGKKHIADLYNGEDFREIADKIRTYVEVELGKEIEEIVDGVGQSLLESLNENSNLADNILKAITPELNPEEAACEIKEDEYDDGTPRLLVYVMAEYDYEQMTALADKLNPIIAKFDENAYFDQETTGRMVASVEVPTEPKHTKPVDLFDLDDVEPEVVRQLEYVAKEYLGIDTLKTQNSDHKDFHEVSVWGLAQALYHAYALGQEM